MFQPGQQVRVIKNLENPEDPAQGSWIGKVGKFLRPVREYDLLWAIVEFPDDQIPEDVEHLREAWFYYEELELYEAKKLYVLSDGHEEGKMVWFTLEELAAAQKEAEEQSDGNWSWYPVR